MQRNEILKRLMELERKIGQNLPEVYAEYNNGDKVKYYGLPPIDHLFREDNPINRTYGSSFADLINVLIHPIPNRNIEDFEEI